MPIRDFLIALAPSVVAIGASQSACAGEQFSLDWPLACDLRKTCFIQNYVDHDPSGETLDFRCGHRTYDGHDGTDIRLPDMEVQRKGIEVRAAAAGQVSRTRDDMADVSVRATGRDAIAERDCGNGVIINHGQGWSTQYCHLAKGSIRVRPGEMVGSKQVIGLVGLSGNTEFPHLHLTVRHNAAVVDPFAYEASPGGCNDGHSIWAPSLTSELHYQSGEIINAGFSDEAVTLEAVETGEVKRHALSSHSKAIVAYVRAIGLEAGDELAIELRLPDGSLLSAYRSPRLEKDQAQYFAFAGKKLSGPVWVPGTYTATFVLLRIGAEIERRTFQVQIDE